MTASAIITLIIYLMVAAIMIGIGISQLGSSSPVGFYSGEKPPKEDELTNVQLKIVRGKEERGRVDILFETPKLGKVAARFQVQEDSVRGYVVSDSNRTIEALKLQEEGLNGQGESEELQRTMDYVYSDELDLNRFTDEDTLRYRKRIFRRDETNGTENVLK